MAKAAHPKSSQRNPSSTALARTAPRGLTSRDAGSANAGGGSSGSAPSGSAVAALVASQLADMTPSFGNILASIGLGVARSQAALDEGVIETVKIGRAHV